MTPRWPLCLLFLSFHQLTTIIILITALTYRCVCYHATSHYGYTNVLLKGGHGICSVHTKAKQHWWVCHKCRLWRTEKALHPVLTRSQTLTTAKKNPACQPTHHHDEPSWQVLTWWWWRLLCMQQFGWRFDESFPSYNFLIYFFSGDQLTHTPILLFQSGSVHSG